LKSTNQLKFFLAVLLFPLTISAASFDTYLDDVAGYQAAAGSLSRHII
jgi:hypothetical protein